METRTTLKTHSLWAWDNATKSRTLSPLLFAFADELHAIVADQDTFWQEEDRFLKFGKRIAQETRGHHGPAALDYCSKWVGEWTITNNDLEIWSRFRMWLQRVSSDVGLIFEPITRALRFKRLMQAYERYQATGLRKEHCLLLAKMLWAMDMGRGDWMSLFVQGKRPFGNSSIVYDIYEHAEWSMDWNPDDGPSAAQEERAWELFDELVFAAPDAAKLASTALSDH